MTEEAPAVARLIVASVAWWWRWAGWLWPRSRAPTGVITSCYNTSTGAVRIDRCGHHAGVQHR